MYKTLGGDGKEYGPINAETVRQWIAENRLGAASKIRSELSAEWKALAEFPEFADALRAGAPVAPRSQSPPPTPAPEAAIKTSGLAIASLVLGLLGCFGITAIAGLVCGIIALTQISRSQRRLGGNGLAIAGVALSGMMMVFCIPMMAGMLLPALARAKGKAEQINCVNNLKQIVIALRIYSRDNNDRFPADLLQMTNELGTPMILFCPADAGHPRPMSAAWSGVTANNITYQYLTPNAYESNVMSTVVVRCPVHGSVCLGDGSVQTGLKP
jgi:hypothetical protein